MEIISIYDNDGETHDRYTIVLNEPWAPGFLTCLGLSDNPNSPQGFSQFSSCQDGSHLGSKIEFNSLPIEIQNHIIERIK